MARLREAISAAFTCPLRVSGEKGHAILLRQVVLCLGRLSGSETMSSTLPVTCDY